MPTLVWASGFGIGTAAGWTKGAVGSRFVDVSTNPIIGNTSPRTGGFHLTLGSGASQTANIKLDSNTIGVPTVIVASGAFRFRSSLPSTFVDIISLEASGGTCALIYDQPTQKVVMDAADGAGQAFSNITLSADTWYWVDMRIDVSGSTWTIDWRFSADANTPVTQTQATGSHAGTNVSSFDIGRTAAETPVCDYADWIVSVTSGDYPLGKHKVVLLKADTGGTAVEIGTANATARFTSNGSGLDTTFVSSDILAALAEGPPPTIGASASGVYQRTGGTGNAVGIPMTTYTLGAGETISGVRAVICGWASTTTTNNIELRGYDGSAETTLFARADPDFDNNTSSPAWLAEMWANTWDQTKLDAAVLRLGYSNDVLPPPGAHAVYLEVAVKQSTGISGAAGTATETDTAGAVGKSKTKAIGTAAETDAAQTLTRVKSRALGAATETDTAGAISHSKTRAVGSAAETDTAGAVGQLKTLAAAVATETDTAQPFGLSTGQTIGAATETDTAGAITSSKAQAVAAAVEADAAQAITSVKTRSVGAAAETDAARPFTATKARTLGIAAETDAAQSIGHSFARTVGIAGETDSAQPLTHSKRLALSAATETNEARPISATNTIAISTAIETDTAGALAARKRRTVGIAPEADTAGALALVKSRAVGAALETDAARPLGAVRLLALGTAAELDTAQPLGAAKRLLIGTALEFDEAIAFVIIAPSIHPPAMGGSATTRTLGGAATTLTLSGAARPRGLGGSARPV